MHGRFQQQWLEVHVQKYEEGAAAVGGCGKGYYKDSRNGVGMGNDVQGGVSYVTNLR